MMTHRMFSRNSASSRAIHTAKLIELVKKHPVIPLEFGKNRPGMQSTELLDKHETDIAHSSWAYARDAVVEHAEMMVSVGVHKQVVNRILEPFLWHTVIITATEWENFFNLRINKDAQPEICNIANLMRHAIEHSNPEVRTIHHPYVLDEARNLSATDIMRVSSARCARVSYHTHNGTTDIEADLTLAHRLEWSGHMSPFEHAAIARNNVGPYEMYGNFRGWNQYRKTLPGESVFYFIGISNNG